MKGAGDKVRVTIVSPYSWDHPGGVNNHIEGLAAQLAHRGHAVVVIAPDGGRPIDGAGFETAGRSIPVRANGSVARIALLPGTRRRVSDALARGDPDVVHVHEPLVPRASTSAVVSASCRVVATFHAAGTGSAVYRLGSALARGLPGKIDARIAVSEPARALAERYLPGSYEIIPNGVDLSRFSPDKALPVAGRGPEVLFVGRNERRKGAGVLFESFGKVCSEIEGVRLKVVGSGFNASEVARALPAGLRDRVEVAGFVPNEDLPVHYASADVFCAPAVGGESFGVVLLEAMASGTPVVASDIPGYAGVVEQAGGGLLFRTGDPADLARSLVRLLRDESLRARMRDEGLSGVRAFSWEALTPRLEAVYAG